MWFCLDRRDGHAVTICGFVKFGRMPRSVLPGLPRLEAPHWAIGRKSAIEWLEENGFPEPGDGGQAALERYVADVLAARGYHPAESTIRGYVRRWIDEYRGRVNKGSLRAEPHLTY